MSGTPGVGEPMSANSTTLPFPNTTGPFTISTIIGDWTATTLYGLSLALFFMTVSIMYNRRRRGINLLLSTSSILLFCLTTSDVVLQCNHVLIGLLYTPGIGKDIYFENVGNWAQVTHSAIALFTVWIGDGIMMYRVWTVWGRRWLFVIFNSALWLGTIACSIRAVELQASYMNDQTNLAILIDQDHWAIATIVLSFTQTTLATGMIAFRIWKIDHASSTSKATSLMPVIQIVVESGLLYMLFLLAYLVALVLQSPALLFLSQIISPITSIAFYLIIVRVGLSKHGGSNGTFKNSEMGNPMGSISVHREFTVHRTDDRDQFSMMEGGEAMRMTRIKELDASSDEQVEL